MRPTDVKDLNQDELTQLAQELRSFIISTVAQTGGHLASNLGVIELTLALCKVFDFPQDKIVWDVGHQSYAFKILTGRKDLFSGLRQWQGLAGFPKSEESAYDFFNTGHSSTSISAALGILRADSRLGNGNHVIACIGDGALTGGMSFEALNDVGEGDENLIVLINDNQMSISANVGGLKNHLNMLRTSQSYLELKGSVGKSLHKIPLVGEPMVRMLAAIKRFFRRRVTRKRNTMYETLGFKYYGPVNGHNLEELEKVLTAAKLHEGPVIVHVLTVKGMGYEPAVSKPENYHGVAPFVVETGVPENSATVLAEAERGKFPEFIQDLNNYGDAFSYSLQYLAHRDNRLVGICAAMAGGTKMDSFAEAFPERFFDVGIAEQHAVTMAAGMAIAGLRPVVALYSTFLQRALDQVLHDVVLQELPVVFCLDRTGVVGEDGETHQGLYDLAFLQALPYGMVFTPRNGQELFQAFTYALEQDKGPYFIRYPKGSSLFTLEQNQEISAYLTDTSQLDEPVYRAQFLKPGHDLTLIAWGYTTSLAYEAALALEQTGYHVRVLDLREIKQLDWTRIKEALSSPCLIVEEAIFSGSVSEHILAKVQEQRIEANIRSIYIENVPVTQGKRDIVLQALGISVENIYKTALEMLADKESNDENWFGS